MAEDRNENLELEKHKLQFQEKLERLRLHLQLLFEATARKEGAVLTVAPLAATLLVIATFNEKLLPLNTEVRILITTLLVLIPLALFTYLKSADVTANKSLKYIDQLTDSEVSKSINQKTCLNEYLAYFPYCALIVITIVILLLIRMIWTHTG